MTYHYEKSEYVIRRLADNWPFGFLDDEALEDPESYWYQGSRNGVMTAAEFEDIRSRPAVNEWANTSAPLVADNEAKVAHTRDARRWLIDAVERDVCMICGCRVEGGEFRPWGLPLCEEDAWLAKGIASDLGVRFAQLA